MIALRGAAPIFTFVRAGTRAGAAGVRVGSTCMPVSCGVIVGTVAGIAVGASRAVTTVLVGAVGEAAVGASRTGSGAADDV